jgi:hypothetical protein
MFFSCLIHLDIFRYFKFKHDAVIHFQILRGDTMTVFNSYIFKVWPIFFFFYFTSEHHRGFYFEPIAGFEPPQLSTIATLLLLYCYFFLHVTSVSRNLGIDKLYDELTSLI